MNRQSQTQMAQSARSTMLQTDGLLQRKCACGNHTIAGGECEKCREEERALPKHRGKQRAPN